MKIKCPACEAVLSVPDTAAGKVVKCPCGKQLRAPGGAGPVGNSPGTSGGTGANPVRPTPTSSSGSRPMAASSGGRPQAASNDFDSEIFDELTSQDLSPVRSAARPGQASRPFGGGFGNPYAPTVSQGHRPSGNASIAGVGSRLLGSIVDAIFYGAAFGVGFAMVVALASILGEQRSDAMAYLAITLLLLPMIVAIIVNAVLIAKSGQSVGKKAVGTRIVMESSGELPGFVHG